MKMKNLKPQQAAPVQREINTASSEGEGLLTPLLRGYPTVSYSESGGDPFAGDDAE